MNSSEPMTENDIQAFCRYLNVQDVTVNQLVDILSDESKSNNINTSQLYKITGYALKKSTNYIYIEDINNTLYQIQLLNCPSILEKLTKEKTRITVLGSIQFSFYSNKKNSFWLYINLAVCTYRLDEIEETFSPLDYVGNKPYLKINNFPQYDWIKDKSYDFFFSLDKLYTLFDSAVTVICSDHTNSSIWNDIIANINDEFVQQEKIKKLPIKISNPDDIVEAIANCTTKILIIARGGGDQKSFDVFNDNAVLEQLSKFKKTGILITALGHTQDINKADILADFRMNIPGSLSPFLNAYFNFFKEYKELKRMKLELYEKNRFFETLQKALDETERNVAALT